MGLHNTTTFAKPRSDSGTKQGLVNLLSKFREIADIDNKYRHQPGFIHCNGLAGLLNLIGRFLHFSQFIMAKG